VAGPSLAGMQLYTSMVRSCVTDMGLEWDLAEVPDCTAVYFKDWVNEEDVEAARGTFLFPLAIRLPGPSHIMDWVLKDVCPRPECCFYIMIVASRVGSRALSFPKQDLIHMIC